MSRTTIPAGGSPQDRLRAIRQAAEEDSLELLAEAVGGLAEAEAARSLGEAVESGIELAEMALVAASPRFRDAPA